MPPNPSTGRTVYVSDPRNLSSSFRRLDFILRDNRVQKDANYQRYYEKPTLKRQRIRSEVHRARFKAGIQILVGTVKRMRSLGI